MNAKMLPPINRSDSGTQVRLSQRLLMLVLVVALFIGQIAVVARLGAATDADENQYSSYTDRYWEAAAARATDKTEVANEYASYTDRYWQAAAARNAEVTETVDEYASYTDRYWEAAAARAMDNTEVANEYASYTDRYWQAAAARNVHSAAIDSTSN